VSSYAKNKEVRREGLKLFSSDTSFLKVAAKKKESGWGKVGKGVGYGLTGLYYADTARGVAAGETSAGGALGDVAGFHYGQKASDKWLKPGIEKGLSKLVNIKKGPGRFLSGAAKFIAGDLVAPTVAGAAAGKVGNKIIPWKRNVNKIQAPTPTTTNPTQSAQNLNTRVNMNPYRNN
jgi:hypothetical protein